MPRRRAEPAQEPDQGGEPGVIQRMLSKVLRSSVKDLEAEYQENRQRQADELFDRFYQVVQEVGPTTETLLYVLKQIEFLCLTRNTNKLVGPGKVIVTLPQPEGSKGGVLGPGPAAAKPDEAATGSKAAAIPLAIG